MIQYKKSPGINHSTYPPAVDRITKNWAYAIAPIKTIQMVPMT
uniref:Uncharacterized protein n=1 Tax=viral metagenome TaxID=1070528 RepID=A0A6C0DXK8_9ZZZZ